MLANKVIILSFTFGTILLLGSGVTLAQNSPLATQIALTKHDKSPFKEGKTIIAEISFEGLNTDEEIYGFRTENGLYESDFLIYHTSESAKMARGDKFTIEKVSNLIVLLKRWLAGEGYLKANVIAYGTTLSDNRMKLTFSIERGIPLDPPELNFVGNLNISTQEFIDDFKGCSGSSWERYDVRKYQYYARQCSQQLLFSRGFFRGKIYDIRTKLSGNRYLITFSVSEGVRYRWGEIKIEGAKEFSNKEILEMFGQNPGDVADGRYLRDFVYEKLKDAYGERGYVGYNSEFDPELVEPNAEGLDGTVNILISIDDGCKFTVNRVEFFSIGVDEQKALKENFPLKPQDIFVRSKFEKGIADINKSGQYRPADKDNDVEILVDEQHCNLDLIIRLTKVNR